MNRFSKIVCGTIVGLMGLSMASCASPSRLSAVPLDVTDRATVLGRPEMRSWEDALSPEFLNEIIVRTKHEVELYKATGATGPLPPANYLVISGGGADGAYGAGLLAGWTATGTRPDFKLVTGISTGALTAPFAFLGPKYDEKLKALYTTTKTADLLSERGMLAALFDDALMDTSRLRELVARTFDDQMLKDIAAEYQKGRILLVATTNLDSGRAVIWNIGAIASSGHKDAAKLIHSALVASAAIPGAFPPVMIDVDIDGKKYQEMHVDGGATAQLFLYPPEFKLRSEATAQGITRERHAYIIRNARLDSHWSEVKRRTFSIAGRAISALIQNQGIGDLYRVYLITQRDKVDYNLAYIPKSFDVESKEDFDPVYMQKLYDLGLEAAKKGNVWAKYPPDFAVDDVAPTARVPAAVTP